MADGGQTGTSVDSSADIDLSYVTLAEAQTYFNNILNTDNWDDATEGDKIKALVMATKAIDRLNFLGKKTVSTQSFQFPRYNDTSVPQDIKDAVCEEALVLVGGADITMEKEAARMTGQGFGSVRTAFDVELVTLHLSAGLVSAVAFNIIKPYLRLPSNIDIIKI